MKNLFKTDKIKSFHIKHKTFFRFLSIIFSYSKIIVLLTLLWFIFSGTFKPFLVICGVVSIVATFIICKIAKIFSVKSYLLKFTFIQYVILLIKDIIVSTINITKIVYADKIKINPGTISINTNLINDQEKVMLANLITMTPGTFVIAVNGDEFLIHSLNYDEFTSNKKLNKIFEKSRKAQI